MALPKGITVHGSPDSDSPLVQHARRQLVRALVMRAIYCPRTGVVLDMRTCVVLNDRDGDPGIVLSQEGWATLPEEKRRILAEQHGLTVDESTVKA
jgi:hypothetical protein